MCCPRSPGAWDKCIASRITGRNSFPDGFQQSMLRPPHTASTVLTNCFSLFPNGHNWGQVLDVFSEGMSERECADPDAGQYVLVAQDKSLDLLCRINTDHFCYYLLLTRVDSLLGLWKGRPPKADKTEVYSFIYSPPHSSPPCACCLIGGWMDR